MRLVTCGIWSAVLLVSLVCCSLSRGQILDFKVDGPQVVAEGEYVELTVLYPEGVQADVDFTPVAEDVFGVHPIVSETLVKGKLVPKIVGKRCTFSARCMGARTITVVATAFAMFDGTPRLKSIKHSIAVTGKTPPVGFPPTDSPPAPPGDDIFIPVPAAEALPVMPTCAQRPQAALSQEDDERLARIFDNILNRLEAEEQTNERFLTRLEELDKGVSDIEAKLEEILNNPPPKAAPKTQTTAAPVPAAKPAAPTLSAAQIAYANRKPGEVWVTKVCGVPVEPYREGVAAGQTSSLPTVLPCKVGVIPALPTGGRWNIEGNWNPSYGYTMSHLREPKHAPFSAQYEPLERFNHGQLRWIHDQHHDQLAGRAPTQYAAPVSYARQQAVGSACPGGVCPTPGASRGFFRGGFLRGR